MACPCPNCGRPKDCGDELCVLCELKLTVGRTAQQILKGKDARKD